MDQTLPTRLKEYRDGLLEYLVSPEKLSQFEAARIGTEIRLITEAIWELESNENLKSA